MNHKQLVVVGVVLTTTICLLSIMVCNALAQSRRIPEPIDGHSATNGLLFTFRYRPGGTSEDRQFECELKNVSGTNMTIRQMVHGLNLNCWYRPVGGAAYEAAILPRTSLPMHPPGSFALPTVVTLKVQEAYKYTFSLDLPRGEFECYATYTVKGGDTNATWHGIIRTPPVKCAVR